MRVNVVIYYPKKKQRYVVNVIPAKKKMICGWVGKKVGRLRGYFRRGRELKSSIEVYYSFCFFDVRLLFPLAVPTAELVKRVKELYHKRVSDVRFLIPVLTGLTKQEIIAVLPKLIKQSPSVVKEVFNRLLGCFHSE